MVNSKEQEGTDERSVEKLCCTDAVAASRLGSTEHPNIVVLASRRAKLGSLGRKSQRGGFPGHSFC